MGTTLANFHILNGDLEQIRNLMPEAVVGIWSSHCVSVFAPDLTPATVDKKARVLSQKISQPVLSVWLFDSDAVGISIFQGGKCVTAHVLNPDGRQKPGNASLFCRIWNLSEEDIPRLRMVWKRGNGETQLDLTSYLLGLPLHHNSSELPERPCRKETEPVDRWIKERPMPRRIRNQAKAELIQELPKFRYYPIATAVSSFYVSVDPYDDPYAYDRYHLWEAQADGRLREIWATEHNIRFFTSSKRVVCTDFYTGDILYDSAGQLSTPSSLQGQLQLLENGKILQLEASEDGMDILTYLTQDGTVLWRRRQEPQACRILSQNDLELLIQEHRSQSLDLVCIDLATGRENKRVSGLVGLNIYQAVWSNKAWWIAHDGLILDDGNWNQSGHTLLTKLDGDMKPLAQVPLPSITQEVFFSPDQTYVYLFFFQNQVQVLETELLNLQETLQENVFLASMGFDKNGIGSRFWLQRGDNTVEAWDETLTTPISRHRLSGMLIGRYRDRNGRLCVSTWDERKMVFRIFRFT